MQHKMLPPILSCWLAALVGWWWLAPCLVCLAIPSMILHTARIQEHHHAHPSLELVLVVVLPSYHDSCKAICLQPWPTAASLQAKHQSHSCSIAEPASHPNFQLASKPQATIGYIHHQPIFKCIPCLRLSVRTSRSRRLFVCFG
jgi:hypothetical protein